MSIPYKKTIYVVTRSEEHADYVEKAYTKKSSAEAYCEQFNNDDDSYHRDITEIQLLVEDE